VIAGRMALVDYNRRRSEQCDDGIYKALLEFNGRASHHPEVVPVVRTTGLSERPSDGRGRPGTTAT
jgi:hypothetical protein